MLAIFISLFEYWLMIVHIICSTMQIFYNFLKLLFKQHGRLNTYIYLFALLNLTKITLVE